jgi:hypothetical protein
MVNKVMHEIILNYLYYLVEPEVSLELPKRRLLKELLTGLTGSCDVYMGVRWHKFKPESSTCFSSRDY